jgi:diguanylate cyclase (GGDEF)-like protein/PAS domain S-box-containing protein
VTAELDVPTVGYGALLITIQPWLGSEKQENVITAAPHACQMPNETADIGLRQLDLLSVAAALQAVSSRIVADQVLDVLMPLLLKHGGAQNAYLLLCRGSALSLAAAAEVTGERLDVRLFGEGEGSESGLPVAILEHVRTNRTKLILADVTDAGRFSTDECLSTRQAKSVLCLPMIRQTELVGLLYLENKLVTHAFTTERLAALELLAAQAVISLEHARLYANLLRKDDQRREVEATLAAERNLLRTLVENIPDSIYAKDAQSRFIFGNLAVARVMGAATAEELLGKTDFDFYPAELAARFFADEQALIRSGGSLIDHEEPGIDRTTGARLWMLATKVPIRDSNGLIAGIIGIGRDITEQKRAQAEVLSLNAELERRVTERTAELVQTNTALQAEVAQRRALEVVLSTERQLLRTLMDTIPDAIYAKDLESRFIFGNVAVARIMGAATPQDLLGKTDFDFYPAEQAAQFFAAEQVIIRAGKALIDHEEVINADRPGGEIRWHSSTKVPLRDSDGELSGIVGISRDITARKQTEQAMRLRNRAIESSVNAILITDFGKADNPIEYVNPAFERITGYAAAEALGCNIGFLLAHEPEQSGVAEIQAAIDEQREGHALLRNLRKDGSLFWNDLHVAPVRDEAGKVSHFVWILNDITETRNYQEQLHRQASYDALTGLPNRRLLLDRLTQALAIAERAGHIVAVAFLDLDRFKFINDTLGHGAGDELLLIAAERLSSSVRQSDTVARLGGDEFVVILPDQSSVDHTPGVVRRIVDSVTSQLDIVEALHKIVSATAQPVTLLEKELSITFSVGVSFFPQDGRDVETLLKNADAAMYQAKEKGRNNLQFYTAEMNARMAEKLALEGMLSHALEREEFELAYQPKIDLRSGDISGVEALLRWTSLEQGMIPPSTFIPVLERTGMINEVGRWVLCQAVAEQSNWLAAGLALPRVAVNVSQVQLDQKNFVDVVKGAMQGDLGAKLDLEITESLIMKNVETNIPKLRALREMGLSIAIDDFGTGYSSLNHLAKLPVNALKIDRTFVMNIAASPSDLAIITAIISLAHSMGLKVIAEGVETEQQKQLLSDLRCDEIQGYLIAKPLRLDRYLEWQKQFVSQRSQSAHARPLPS